MSKSQNPLFGRAWELVVAPAGEGQTPITVSSAAWDPETLRIVFEASLPSLAAFWFAKIAIYNANKTLEAQLLVPGATVTLKAGYQTQPYGIIYQGTVYQALFEREGGVDYKVTLLCYCGLPETIANFASMDGSPQMSQAAIVQKMAESAHTPIKVGAIDTTALGTTTLPRARAFFGDPNKFFDQVASANNMQTWYGFAGMNLSTMELANTVSTITYTPTTGLLDTPQQTQDGVVFRVLLDPRLEVTSPPQQVNIAGAVIRQIQNPPGNGYPPILDAHGLYLVIGVNFVGDSRGNEWYAEVVGATSVGGKLAMIANTVDPSVQLDRRSPK